MNDKSAVSTEDTPHVLFGASSASPKEIAVPELLSFEATHDVLMQSPMSADIPAFIFPGVLLVAQGKVFYISAGDLTLFEGSRDVQDATTFLFGGVEHTLSAKDIEEFQHVSAVRLRDPLPLDSELEVLGGSLLRDTQNRLYYIAPGVFGTFTSFSTVRSATP